MLVTWWALMLLGMEFFVKPEALEPPELPASPKADRDDAPLRCNKDSEVTHECEVEL